MTYGESAYIPLQDTLSAKRADFEARASDEKKRIYAEGISAVESTGILRSAKQVGDTAVYFTLPVASGAAIVPPSGNQACTTSGAGPSLPQTV